MDSLNDEAKLVKLLNELKKSKRVRIFNGPDEWIGGNKLELSRDECPLEAFAKLLELDFPRRRQKVSLFNFPRSTEGKESVLQDILCQDLGAALAIDTHKSTENCPSWMFGRNDGIDNVIYTLNAKPDLTSRVRSMYFEVKANEVRIDFNFFLLWLFLSDFLLLMTFSQGLRSSISGSPTSLSCNDHFSFSSKLHLFCSNA